MTYIPGLFGTGSIGSHDVTDDKLAQMPAHTVKGNHTGSTANPEDMTATQTTALLDAFTGDSGSGGAKGLVPTPAAGDAAAGKVLGAGGAWTTVAGGSGTPQLATVSLNASQLLASHTTPIQVIAAPGAGKAIIVLGTAYSYAFGTTPYSTAGGPSGLYYDPPATNNEPADGLSNDILGFVSASAFGTASGVTNNDPTANFANRAIVFYSHNSDPTGGDGTLKISAVYVAVPT